MAIGEVCKRNPQFSFRCVNKDEILKEILDLDVKRFKSLSGFGYPIKNFKEDAYTFTDFLHFSFNNSIYQSESSS